MPPTSHYEVLGVAPDARPDEVRRAYLDLARRHHPDRAGGDAARMRAVTEAWATLGDPGRRRTYDLTLGAAPAPSASWVTSAPGGARDDETDLDLLDDRPFGSAAPSGWFAVVPVALFAASVLVGVVGLLVALPALLGLAGLLFALSCLAFVAAPLLSLYASRRGTGAGDVGAPR